MIIETVNEHTFRDAFQNLRPINFSREGLGLLFECLDKLFPQILPRDLCDMASEADAIAVECAALSAYLGARHVNGCGDAGHEAGLVAAVKARKAVRSALGFTRP